MFIIWLSKMAGQEAEERRGCEDTGESTWCQEHERGGTRADRHQDLTQTQLISEQGRDLQTFLHLEDYAEVGS